MKINKTYGLKQGRYMPLNPEKYCGTVPIVYRSSYELRYMQYIDRHASCIRWSSESTIVVYFDPVAKKNRRYFLDFMVEMQETDGTISRYFVEIKPYRETIPPVMSKRKKAETYTTQLKTYITNCAKWEAATGWCEKYGHGKFIIITEKVLFH